MKYFTQTTKMQNYGKLYRFLMIAMMMLTSGMAWAQTQTQTLNISTSGTYTLTSTENGNQFQCGNSTYDYLGNVARLAHRANPP